MSNLIQKRLDVFVDQQPAEKQTNEADPACYDILVPIFEGAEILQTSLPLLHRHTSDKHRIVLLDDASRSPDVAKVLQQFCSERPDTTLIRQPANQGFPGNVNTGLTLSDRDVIVLNADTMVSEGWIEALHTTATVAEDIGIVCPFSDNATILSVSQPATKLNHPKRLTKPIALPTAVGFCMLIKRRVIDTIGVLDLAFGLGYGEENDYSMRAMQAGFRIVACEDAYVRHVGGISFKKQLIPPVVQNQALLNARWPNYPDLVSRFDRFYPWRAHQEYAYLSGRDPDRPALLHVVHQFGQPGGTEGQVRSLMLGIRDYFNQAVLYHRRGASEAGFSEAATDANGIHHILINRRALTSQHDFMGQAGELSDPAVEALLASVISAGYQTVHFHHLTGFNSLLLPMLAKRLGCRVVISLHDWYALCPDFNMIARSNLPCGKLLCQPNDEDCVQCLGGKLQRGRPGSIPEYIALRQQLWRDSLNAADIITAPSRYVAERIAKALGPNLLRKMQVVAPGINTIDVSGQQPQKTGQQLVVGVPGGLSYRKGGELFLNAAAELGDRLRFCSFGVHDDRLKIRARQLNVKLSGAYHPDQLAEHLQQLDVAVIPSLCEETFSLVLSECFACGVPVIASDLGALSERITDRENGFLFPAGDQAALTELLSYCDSEPGRQHLAAIRQTLKTQQVADLPQMTDRYLELYRQIGQLPNLERPQLSRDIFPSDYKPQGIGSTGYQRWMHYQLPADQSKNAVSVNVHVLEFWHPNHGDHLSRTLRNLAQQQGSLQITLIKPIVGEEPELSDYPLVNVVSVDSLAENWQQLLQQSKANLLMMMEAGDTLERGFLPTTASRILADENTLLAYTDDDLTTVDQHRYQAHFRPAFDIDLFRATGYIQQASVYRKNALEDIPLQGFANLAELSYQIVLELYRRNSARAFSRIPSLLYHRADINVIRNFPRKYRLLDYLGLHLKQSELGAELTIHDHTVNIRYTNRLTDISVAVISFGDLNQLGHCLSQFDSALGTVNAEFIIISHHPLNEQELSPFAPGPLRCLQINTRHSLLNHGLLQAAEVAQHKALLVVDEQTEFATEGGIEILCGYWGREGSAAVGPLIYDKQSTKSHLGIVLGLGSAGIAGIATKMESEGFAGRFPRSYASQGVAALSWRGMLTDRQMFLDHHGFNPHMGADYGHVDYCLKLTQQRYRCVAVPEVLVEFNHPYPVRATPVELIKQRNAMRSQWLDRLSHDPFYHPMLSLRRGDWSVDHDAESIIGSPDSGIRVLAFPNDDWASGYYRVRQPLMMLAENHQIQLFLMPASTQRVFPNLADLKRKRITHILLHHGFHDYQLNRLAEIRHFTDIQIIFSLDDLLSNVPEYNSAAPTIYPDIAERIHKGLGYGHKIVLSTKTLAETVDHQHLQPHVITNAIDTESWPETTSVKKGSKLRIGWAGAAQHANDLLLLQPVIERTQHELDWVFLGNVPDQLHPLAREIRPPVPFNKYPESLANLALDIAVAPLVSNDFNRCKSALRLLEYGAAGFSVIASDIEPYRNTPAICCGTEPEEWLTAIEKLRDTELRKQHADDLRQWVLGQHCAEHRAASWLQVFTASVT